MSGRAHPVLIIFVDDSPQPANPARLKDVFKRQSTDAARRMRAALAQIAVLEDSRETRAALRRLRREMREWDRIGGRQVRVRMPKPPSGARRRTPKVQISRASKGPLPRYSGPIIDREGRKGIFLDLEYDGAQKERNGVARRRIAYQFRLDHAQTVLGMPVFCSNMGADENEVLACADMLEMVNRAARKNAKVGINAILQCPSELDLAGRVAFLERVAKHFDALGIAYCMTLHRPDPEGDQRNHHLHIWFTLRSIEHVGVRDWMVGKQLRTDLDGPEAMYALRRECADIATETCYEYGRNVRYTHLSNAARRLPHLPQQKLGKRSTAKVRRDEYDATNEANRQLIAQNEALAHELAERKARAVRPIIASALGSTSVPSIALPRVAEVPALTMPLLSVPLSRHAEKVVSIDVPPATLTDRLGIAFAMQQDVLAARNYANGIVLPAINPSPIQAGKGVFWPHQFPLTDATLSKVPAIMLPVLAPTTAPYQIITLPMPTKLSRGHEQIRVPNALSNSGTRTGTRTVSLPLNTEPAQKLMSVPIQYGPVLPLNGQHVQHLASQSGYASYQPIVLPQKALMPAERDARSNNLVAEIEGLLANIDIQALALASDPARKQEDTPPKPEQQPAIVGMWGAVVIHALGSSVPPTPDSLIAASRLFDEWQKEDTDILNRYIETMFDRTPAGCDMHRWLMLLKQPSGTNRDLELAELTKQIMADEAVMIRIRAQTPLLELLLFRQLQRHSIEHSSARGGHDVASKDDIIAPQKLPETIIEAVLESPLTLPTPTAKAALAISEPVPESKTPDPAILYQEVVLHALAERALSGVRWEDAGNKRMLVLTNASAERLDVPARIEIAAGLVPIIDETIAQADQEETILRRYIERRPDLVQVSKLRILLPEYADLKLLDIAKKHSQDPERRKLYAAMPGVEKNGTAYDKRYWDDFIASPEGKAVAEATDNRTEYESGPLPIRESTDDNKAAPRFAAMMPATIKDKGRKLQVGIHPMLDAYLAADASKDDAARRRIAKEIANDEAAALVVKSLTAADRKSIKDDSRYNDLARGNSPHPTDNCGREVGHQMYRGLSPEAD